jgi:hypothetical protein
MPKHYNKKGTKKTTTKKVPKGFHKMPDGSIMKNGTHKKKGKK